MLSLSMTVLNTNMMPASKSDVIHRLKDHGALRLLILRTIELLVYTNAEGLNRLFVLYFG